MTLYRQLIGFILLLFILLFSGAWLAKLDSTRVFLVDQLESHAQDTATSLGVSVSQYMAEGDLPAVETMVNAVFDRGYYRTIRLFDMEGHLLLKRELKVEIEHVPTWFIGLVSLETPDVTAKVMSGWYQAGNVFVQSHPGYAYKTLWEAATRMTIWFVGIGVVVIIAGGVGLRLLLQPLKRVERQADALCRKQYEIQERLPRTKELRQVVKAMNRMTCKVRDIFVEQVATAEMLRGYAYTDPVTGLGNRRYFEGQVNARLESREKARRGILLLIQIHGLQELNQAKGFVAGDEMLKRVAMTLKKCTNQAASCALAHLSGADFAIFLPEAFSWEAEPFAASISKKLSCLAAEQLTFSDNVGHVGAVTYETVTTLSQLLSEADLALHAAQIEGPNRWQVRSINYEHGGEIHGEQSWKAFIERAIQEQKIELHVQSVVASADPNHCLHLEVFSRIHQGNGHLLNAGVFMPFAERLKIVSALDRFVIDKVRQLDKNQLGVDTLAVNLSPASLEDNLFRSWLEWILTERSEAMPRLIFEFAEFSAVQHLERVKELCLIVKRYGQGVGLDHYGQSFSHLGYLNAIRPDYVKIDRAFARELDNEKSDSRFFISSLCSVAHSLDIEVVAEGVETEQQWMLLKEMSVDAMQGYFIDKPKPITQKT